MLGLAMEGIATVEIHCSHGNMVGPATTSMASGYCWVHLSTPIQSSDPELSEVQVDTTSKHFRSSGKRQLQKGRSRGTPRELHPTRFHLASSPEAFSWKAGLGSWLPTPAPGVTITAPQHTHTHRQRASGTSGDTGALRQTQTNAVSPGWEWLLEAR